VNLIRFASPWAQRIWNVLKEDLEQFPHNWKSIPSGRRAIYAVTGFVSCYYFVVSLYAIPLVALGFLAPAYICRQYLDNDDLEPIHSDDNNNNEDVNNVITSVKEMSQWMKFWVTLCGWLLIESLAPRVLTAILPLNIITLIFVITSLAIPWKSNPAVLSFDRMLLPLFQWMDVFVAGYKQKIIEIVSNLELRNKRRRD